VGQPGRRGAEQECDQWFVVSEQAKTSPFQQKSEVSDCAEAASSSLSKVEYLVPAPDSFFE
jgi:hypothetical protein